MTELIAQDGILIIFKKEVSGKYTEKFKSIWNMKIDKRIIMQTDRTTKGLLLLITVALWGLLFTSLFLKTPSMAHESDAQRVIIVGMENQKNSYDGTLPVTLQYLSSGASLPVHIVKDEQSSEE